MFLFSFIMTSFNCVVFKTNTFYVPSTESPKLSTYAVDWSNVSNNTYLGGALVWKNRSTGRSWIHFFFCKRSNYKHNDEFYEIHQSYSSSVVSRQCTRNANVKKQKLLWSLEKVEIITEKKSFFHLSQTSVGRRVHRERSSKVRFETQ